MQDEDRSVLREVIIVSMMDKPLCRIRTEAFL
jgi:hypothetical protein